MVSGGTEGAVTHAGRQPTVRLLTAGLLAGAVTAAIYTYGRVLTPDYAKALFGQNGRSATETKSWLASAVVALMLGQLALALRIYGRRPWAKAGPASAPVRRLHRASGLTLFLLTLPVAWHCLRAYGVQTYSPRVAVHAVAGCFFYGVFAAKVLLVRSSRLPGWALPVAGGLLAVVVAVLWYSSALWFFSGGQLSP